MAWRKVKLGELMTESKIPSEKPCPTRRIRVRLNVSGVEQRPVGNEKKGATAYYIRRSGQFIFGKQNFHKGAFGVIPKHLDGFESSADIPSFDIREDCLPEWIYYFFKCGNRYLELSKLARGVGSKRIHAKQLTDIEIPLPSIGVQQSILRKANSNYYGIRYFDIPTDATPGNYDVVCALWSSIGGGPGSQWDYVEKANEFEIPSPEGSGKCLAAWMTAGTLADDQGEPPWYGTVCPVV